MLSVSYQNGCNNRASGGPEPHCASHIPIPSAVVCPAVHVCPVHACCRKCVARTCQCASMTTRPAENHSCVHTHHSSYLRTSRRRRPCPSQRAGRRSPTTPMVALWGQLSRRPAPGWRLQVAKACVLVQILQQLAHGRSCSCHSIVVHSLGRRPQSRGLLCILPELLSRYQRQDRAVTTHALCVSFSLKALEMPHVPRLPACTLCCAREAM